MVDKETGVILWLEHVCGSSLDCERFSEHFSGSFSANVSYLCFYPHLPSRAGNRGKSGEIEVPMHFHDFRPILAKVLQKTSIVRACHTRELHFGVDRRL